MKKLTLALLVSMTVAPVFADTPIIMGEQTEPTSTESEFLTDEKLEEGLLTRYINRAIEKGMAKVAQAPADGKLKFGRKITDYVTAPKFGGYVIGTYKYNSGDKSNTFNARLVRLYLDGTILRDFKYRLQLQMNGSSPHVKDFFIDWQRWKEFGVKIGQYKRSFAFENPYNPWDVGVGDYSQLVQQFAGMGDNMVGEANMGGRDQGLQIHGDLFPISQDKHRLLHYEFGIYNGQGINTADKNKRKDFIGTIQFQPIKNLFIGAFYWNGNYVKETTTQSVDLETGEIKNNKVSQANDRSRLDVGVKYETTGWSARMEYAREFADNGYKGADAFYATVGIPCTSWLKTYVKYDNYNSTGNWGDGKHIFSLAPNFQLHKNLMFQLQYNCVYNAAASNTAHQVWVETYFRF